MRTLSTCLNTLIHTHMGTFCACLKQPVEFLFGIQSFQSFFYVAAVSERHFAQQHDGKGAWQMSQHVNGHTCIVTHVSSCALDKPRASVT